MNRQRPSGHEVQEQQPEGNDRANQQMHTQIIAELSGNHLGSLGRALRLVQAAKDAGADAVKLQTWMPGRMVLDRNFVLRAGPWAGWRLADLYEVALPWKAQAEVFEFARSIGIECFSSVFDPESLAFLESIGCPRYKIASFELTDLPLIRAVAKTGKPMILSTGIATEAEIIEAVEAADRENLTLLKCTSGYPSLPADANLKTMSYLRMDFDCPVGLSDHTLGHGVAVAAVTLQAVMIEKHLILSRGDGGPDAHFSMEPEEFKAMVNAVRQAEQAWGEVHYGPTPSEQPSVELRRSLYFARDLKTGDTITDDSVRTARPAHGLHPRELGAIIGKTVNRAVSVGEPVTWDVTN